ncbi:MAG: IS21-like element helper ATPase IstB [Candidatus Sericytochromatia bacterium]|nr:IS21-like element helper ATPase IstB [Candidatus Tanganyikabacteria bacterium]
MAKDRTVPPTTLDELKKNLENLKLRTMLANLDTAIEEANTLQTGYVTFLANLVAKEILARTDVAAERRCKAAGFPKIKTFATFDWAFQKNLNVQLIKDLMNLQFIRNGRCLLFLGKPGVGKSHLSTAFGILAAERGYSVRFFKAPKLLTALYATLADGSTDRFIAQLARIDLLIIDDLRSFTPARPEYAPLFLDLVEARHGKGTVLSSNLAIRDWGAVLGNSALTAATVDRLMEGAHVINVKKGKSYRFEGPDGPPEEDRPEGLGDEPDEAD